MFERILAKHASIPGPLAAPDRRQLEQAARVRIADLNDTAIRTRAGARQLAGTKELVTQLRRHDRAAAIRQWIAPQWPGAPRRADLQRVWARRIETGEVVRRQTGQKCDAEQHELARQPVIAGRPLIVP